MQNSAARKHDNLEHKAVVETAEGSVLDFVAMKELIAQQAEEACNLEGNNNCDLDAFAEKYGIACFA